MFDLSYFMKPLKPMKQTPWHKLSTEYVTGDQIDRIYDNGYENGLITGIQVEQARIIKMLAALAAYDEDGDLMLAESWPELVAHIRQGKQNE